MCCHATVCMHKCVTGWQARYIMVTVSQATVRLCNSCCCKPGSLLLLHSLLVQGFPVVRLCTACCCQLGSLLLLHSLLYRCCYSIL